MTRDPDRAREALDSVCPAEGLIFGRHQYRTSLMAAAMRAGFSREDAKHIGSHEWRHAFLMDLGATSTDITGMAFLAGHTRVTTTAEYVKAREAGAARVLDARGKTKRESAEGGGE